MTRRTDIRDDVLAALNTDRPSGVPEANKRRLFPGMRLLSPNIAVYFNEERNELPQGSRSAISRRTLQLIVQCAAPVENPEDGDDALEPLLAWVVSVLANTTLSKKALSSNELGTKWETHKMDLYYAIASVGIEIEYQTNRSDIGSAQ